MSRSKAKILKGKFNTIVYGSVSAHDIAIGMKKEIVVNRLHNPVLGTDTNRLFSECIDGMVGSGRYMRSKDFIVNNIEHLYPRTLRKILGKSAKRPAPIAKSSRRAPKIGRAHV